ncbi:hypothetical protein HIM_03083 [Hirsutella minnesotensis 3608]|nr:hypothetical protein HIM_03083 [Hirsutella minnesotensis 3608]
MASPALIPALPPTLSEPGGELPVDSADDTLAAPEHHANILHARQSSLLKFGSWLGRTYNKFGKGLAKPAKQSVNNKLDIDVPGESGDAPSAGGDASATNDLEARQFRTALGGQETSTLPREWMAWAPP